MSKEYIYNRIKEAMRLHRGNSVKARQQIIAWTYEDSKLLHALARPHLTGIVSYAIDRFQRGALNDKDETRIHESTLDRPTDDEFGKELLRSMVTGKPEIFGEEPSGTFQEKSRASKRHQDAMRLLASKGKKDY